MTIHLTPISERLGAYKHLYHLTHPSKSCSNSLLNPHIHHPASLVTLSDPSLTQDTTSSGTFPTVYGPYIFSGRPELYLQTPPYIFTEITTLSPGAVSPDSPCQYKQMYTPVFTKRHWLPQFIKYSGFFDKIYKCCFQIFFSLFLPLLHIT